MKTETKTNTKHVTRIESLGRIIVANPQYGDMKLSVFPFEHTGRRQYLPEGFKIWEDNFNAMLKHVPLHEGANKHYLTIDSKFFTQDDFLRREGVHIDGNFCADPNFEGTTWGGTGTTWSGIGVTPTLEVVKNWVSPYPGEIPFGTYVSGDRGGILAVSNEIGCQAWGGVFEGKILDEGACDHLADQLTDVRKIVLDQHELYFMSSNTPHETLMINKGTRRTFMRITLNHEYPNALIG
jgi:hypothetical protein